MPEREFSKEQLGSEITRYSAEDFVKETDALKNNEIRNLSAREKIFYEILTYQNAIEVIGGFYSNINSHAWFQKIITQYNISIRDGFNGKKILEKVK